MINEYVSRNLNLERLYLVLDKRLAGVQGQAQPDK
jgi:hypothetical protein